MAHATPHSSAQLSSAHVSGVPWEREGGIKHRGPFPQGHIGSWRGPTARPLRTLASLPLTATACCCCCCCTHADRTAATDGRASVVVRSGSCQARDTKAEAICSVPASVCLRHAGGARFERERPCLRACSSTDRPGRSSRRSSRHNLHDTCHAHSASRPTRKQSAPQDANAPLRHAASRVLVVESRQRRYAPRSREGSSHALYGLGSRERT